MPLFDDMTKMEYIIPAFIISSITYNRDSIFNTAFATQAAAWSYPVASVATVVVSGFYNRLKEDRDFKRAEEQLAQQTLLKSIKENNDLAESFYEHKDFQNALNHYQMAINEFKKQYKSDKPGESTKLAELYYKQALSAIELHNFDLAINNLDKILNELIDRDHVLYTSVINLLALIHIKSASQIIQKPNQLLVQSKESQPPQNLAENNIHLQKAMEYLKESILRDSNQPHIRVLYEF